MKYNVGQILFLLLRKKKSVIPVQITEQVIKKSLRGETVSYSVMLPDESKTVLPLDKLDATVFSCADDIKNHMIDSAKRAISAIVEKSEEMRLQAFPQDSTLDNEKDNELSSSEEIEIVLENGAKGKVKISNLDAVATQNHSSIAEKR